METDGTGPGGPIEDRRYSWPTPRRDKPAYVLALQRADGSIITEPEAGGEIFPPIPFLRLVKLIAARRWLLIVNKLELATWLHDAASMSRIADIGADLSTQALSGAVHLNIGRRTFFIVEAALWGLPAEPASLARLRGVLRAGAVGDYATPGAWGKALMVHTYFYPDGRRPLPMPNLQTHYWELFKRNLVGGRVDAIRIGARLEAAYLYDQNSAYAHAMTTLPVGTPGWWSNEGGQVSIPDGRWPTAYLRATWTAAEDTRVPLSPLPVRGEDGALSYPVIGTFDGWYWLEELQMARALGIAVRCHDGIYFRTVDNRFQRWVETMTALRGRVPPEDAAIVKLATVAAIGSFAAGRAVSNLTTRPVKEDHPLFSADSGLLNPYYIHTQERIRPGLLPHLFSYASMRCRLDTFLVAKAAAEQGSLIASDYDAVITDRPLEGVQLGGRPGQWKVQRLTGLDSGEPIVPAARTIASKELEKRPGVPKR